MIALAAVVLAAAAWPPVQGAVDVQVRNPNLGEPGCVVLQDATVRCWPSAMSVGRWSAENWPRPQLLARPELTGVREFGGRECVLLRNGRVSCMRAGVFADMGITGAVQVVSDGEVGCARLNDGGVSCWGGNRDCRLGPRQDVSRCQDTGPLPPARVQGLPRLKSLALGAGACGLTEEGAVLCWGPHLFVPVARPGVDRVTSLPPLDRLWIGVEVAIGVGKDGRLLAWKAPTYGEAARPIAIPGADRLGAQVAQASISYGFAVLVLRDGTAWVWGYQPGAGRVIPAPPPTWADPIRRVAQVSDAVKATTAHEHACLLTRTGQVRCFGATAQGELGNGTIEGGPVTVPTAVVEITEKTLPDPTSRRCIATRKDRLACLHEGPQCYLAEIPPPVVCAGGAYRRPDRLAPTAPPQPLQGCLCSCSPQYRQLTSDRLRQLDICARIPSARGGARPPEPPAAPR
jgi:hypothetical protein